MDHFNLLNEEIHMHDITQYELEVIYSHNNLHFRATSQLKTVLN